jgi:transaldolase
VKFFIDTANLNEIREAAAMGILDGVTTNPSLVAKEGDLDFKEHLGTICSIVDGPVNGEVVSTDFDGMMREGHDLAAIHPNITVKIPMTRDGLRACKAFSDEGIKTNVTLVFSSVQALMAAKAGATFVSPFIGRLDDIGQDGMELISEITDIFGNYGFATEVLVASVRHPIHVAQAARMGADISTLPFKILEQLFKHPLTDSGLAKFISDWEKTQGGKK